MAKTLKKHDKLNDAFEKYSNSLIETSERRELWKNETKEKIFQTLKLIETTFKGNWQVQKIENIDNYQTINISCISQNSGLIETIQDYETGNVKKRAYAKFGGYLAFCQSYNGKINVLIKLPYIEEWVSEMNVELLDTVEPKEITEENISDFVIKYLDKMLKWENMDRIRIGF